MTITAAVVLFAVLWFMTLFIVLPIRYKSQADAGEIVPGTPAGAPAETMLGRKAKWTTVIAVVLWAVLYGVITSGWISVRDFDWTSRMGPPPGSQQPAP